MPPRKKSEAQESEHDDFDLRSDYDEYDQISKSSDGQKEEADKIDLYKKAQWTRVLKVSYDDIHLTRLHSLKIDIEELEDLPSYTMKKRRGKWGMVWDPDEFEAANPNLQMEQWKLSLTVLKKHAITCSEQREILRARALEIEMKEIKNLDNIEEEMSRLGKKIQKGWHKCHTYKAAESPKMNYEITAPGLRRKRRRGNKLSLDEKMQITERIIMGKESQSDLAKELRLSPATISGIIQKAKKQPETIREAIDKRAEKLHAQNTLVDFIEKFIQENGQINSLKEIIDIYEAETQAKTTVGMMRKAMAQLPRMSYVKIIYQAVQANLERARVQRQQCALQFIKLLKKKTRFISIDETWVDASDYRRRSWQMKDHPNNPSQRRVNPRVTLIVALDSDANLYCSLLQFNSNSETMCVFMKEFVAKLDFEDKNWRSNTVIVWDGAGYHTSNEMIELLEVLQVPVMRLGPYGYLMQSTELVFQSLKSVKLIDRDQALGKKNFPVVVSIVINRLQAMKKSELLMMWHHVILNAFKFLSFHRL